MTEEPPLRLLGKVSKVLEWIGMGLFLAMFASVSVGLSDLVHGLWGLARHGHYAGQEFRLAIHYPELTHKVFKWDQAWWFILILPMLMGSFANQLGEWAEWLALSPDERRLRRDKARVEEKAKAKADEARAALKAREERVQADKEEWRRAKMNKGPMSGWRRLWIVLSVLFGALAFAIAYSSASRAYVYDEPSDYVKTLQGQAYTDAYYAEATRSHPELKACILSTTRVDGNSITCDRDPFNAVFAGIGGALLPAIFMMVVGLTIRWVYRGFRAPKVIPEAHTSEPT